MPTLAWRSAMTVPRTLSLHKTTAGPRLFSTPVNELRLLRGETVSIPSHRFAGALPLQLPKGATAASAEVDLEFLVPPGTNTDVALELSNAAGETYRVGYDASANRYYSDRTATPHSFSPKFATDVHHAPRIVSDSILRMHIYLDRASAELFADGGATAMTDIYFPTQDFATMRLFVKGAPVRLRYATISGMRAMRK